MVNGSVTSLMGKGSMTGQMEDGMKEDGRRTNYIIMEFTHGQTGASMTANTLRTRNMDTEYISGQTARNTRDTGVMENNMGKAALQIHQVRVVQGCGSMGIDKSGCQVT